MLPQMRWSSPRPWSLRSLARRAAGRGAASALLLAGLGCSSESGLGETGGAAGTAPNAGWSGGGATSSAGQAGGGTYGGHAGAVSGGGGSGGGSSGGEQGGQATAGDAGTGGSSAPEIHYVGRVDTSNPKDVRFAWSGTGAIARFDGTSAAVELKGGQEYTVVIDGMVLPKLTATTGTNQLAEGLSPGEHTVELYRRTEASQGESEILGFDFGDGTLLAPSPVTRRIEVVGDSITCGYGNEGANANCSFTPETENHYLTYAAIAARNLKAELSTVAWSGKGVVCNYGDDATSCMDPLPTYYDRTLPSRADSTWDFARFQADAVVVNLGTNDLSTNSDPDQATFEAGYRALLQRIRKAYPKAHILCTNGSMLSGTDLTTVRMYIDDVVADLDDPNISSFHIEPQDNADGLGCDYHPSLATHQKMATVVTAAIKTALGW